MEQKLILKTDPIYQETIKDLELISDVVDSGDKVHIIGGENLEGEYIFVRFEYKAGKWSKNEDYINSEVSDFKRKLKAPKQRKTV